MNMFTDDYFEEMSNPNKYPFGSGGINTHRERSITIRKYFNQQLLHVDGRFAKDIEYLLAAQYAVEHKQVYDEIKHCHASNPRTAVPWSSTHSWPHQELRHCSADDSVR